MICSNCKYQFCWFCLGKAHGHSMSCKVYDAIKNDPAKLKKFNDDYINKRLFVAEDEQTLKGDNSFHLYRIYLSKEV